MAGAWFIPFKALDGVGREWQLVVGALAVPATVSVSVAAVDFVCASTLQIRKGAIAATLGRRLNTLWLAVAVILAVGLGGGALSERRSSDGSLVVGLAGLGGLVLVPLLTFVAYKTSAKSVGRLYLALAVNLVAAAGLGWYIALLRGWGVGAFSISAAYYAGWSLLAACGNVVAIVLALRFRRPRGSSSAASASAP